MNRNDYYYLAYAGENSPIEGYAYADVVEMLSLHRKDCPGHHLRVRQIALQELLENRSHPSVEDNPLQAGGEIVMVGQSTFKYRALKKRLAPFDINVATKITDNTSHVLLGPNPKNTKGLEEIKITLINSQYVQSVLDALEQPYLQANDEETHSNVEQIANLLMSANDDNVLVAIQIIEGGGFPEELIPHAFLAMKQSNDKQIYKSLKKILSRYLDVAARKSIQRTLYLHKELEEFKISKNLKKYTQGRAALDGVAIAKVLFEYHQKGMQYIFTQSKDRALKQAVIKHFIKGNTLDFSNQGFTSLPLEIRDFDNIEVINLANNRLNTIPKALSRMHKVHTLNLANNRLKRITNRLSEMKGLRHLDLRGFWEYPKNTNMLKIQQIETLELSEPMGYFGIEDKVKKNILEQLPNCKITYH